MLERNKESEVLGQKVSREEDDFVDQVAERHVVVDDVGDVVTHLGDDERQKAAAELSVAGKLGPLVAASHRVDADVEELLRVPHPGADLVRAESKVKIVPEPQQTHR